MDIHEMWGFINSGIFLLLAGAIGRYVREIAQKTNAERERREKMLVDLFEENKKLINKVDEMYSKYDELAREVKALKKCVAHLTAGGLSILKDRILQSCRVFVERGAVTMVAKGNIKDMYHFYDSVYRSSDNHLTPRSSDVEEYFNEMCRLPVTDSPVVSSFNLGGDNE